MVSTVITTKQEDLVLNAMYIADYEIVDEYSEEWGGDTLWKVLLGLVKKEFVKAIYWKNSEEQRQETGKEYGVRFEITDEGRDFLLN